MTKRIYMFNPKFGRFNSPSSYYGQVLRNNRDRELGGNARIRKKAQDILNDISKADGWDIMQKAMRDELTFKEWHAHFRAKVSRRNTGINKRWNYGWGLKNSFNTYISDIKMQHDY
jgi:hypothetical protein